ncbi:SAC3 family protein C isoform X2 [Lycium ferocissimum]|uniref:SAC3 family protein C isoform X2 n=1 Tax=Lycium ferocissimum TaxID=112874 RepID=UPI0028159270|nr:SAC3 family protein C isoform X2 [Lycium ferocissimum]
MAGRSQPPYRRPRGNFSSSSSSSSSSRSFQPSQPSRKFKSHPTNNASSDSNNNKTSSTNLDKSIDGDIDDIYNLPSLVGTCPFMCPVEEREKRERLRDLAVFERLYGNPRESSPSLAVKKFCRTISAKTLQDSDVRPLSVLEDTLNYLCNLLDSTEHPFEVVHDFIFDRMRSIRQDLSMQNISCSRVVSMYERMVKFHIISQHKLRRCSGSNISSLSYLNMEQLMKALATLFTLYEANRTSQSIFENEAEFFSFYVLLHLDSKTQGTVKGETLSLWFRRVPSHIMKSTEMNFARKILRYFRLGFYKNFIHITESEASYLQYCIIEPSINEVRALAISCVNYGGYKPQPFPLAALSKLLMMKEWDLESFCNDSGLQTSVDEEGNSCFPTKQTTLIHPKGGLHKYYPLESERFERFSVVL